MNRRKVCVVTGSRSEYGLLRRLMRELKEAPGLQLQVAATGSHFSPAYGNTYKSILADGFRLDAQVRADFDTAKADTLAKAVGSWTKGFADAFRRLRPDAVVVMGDRYELLSVGAACTVMGIPLAHVSGGELTEGAVDDQIRHALTKLAHLHFPSNDVFAGRLLQMGEEGWRVCVSGEPGLDNIRDLTLYSKAELGRELGLDLSRPTALVTFHPVTHELSALGAQLRELTAALKSAPLQYILTYPNADAGSRQVIAAWKAFARAHASAKLFQSLGQRRYLSALKHAALMIGNSSSGLVEAPSFRLPVVNIGSRQDGRIKARNVFDAPCRRNAIAAAVRRALRFDRGAALVNPYGDGRSSARIRKFLDAALKKYSREALLRKRFVDRSVRG